jgi:hypothetical protein
MFTRRNVSDIFVEESKGYSEGFVAKEEKYNDISTDQRRKELLRCNERFENIQDPHRFPQITPFFIQPF